MIYLTGDGAFGGDDDCGESHQQQAPQKQDQADLTG
jgi:hypothetical protein